MSAMLDELNPQQREVALLRRHCVAIACPGAGKTKTIATKAARLLEDPAAVVGAVTFSKAAALELRDRLSKALGQLAPRDRLLVAAHYLDGVQYEDLAEAMQMPLGTVKTHLYRAKQQLRRLLSP